MSQGVSSMVQPGGGPRWAGGFVEADIYQISGQVFYYNPAEGGDDDVGSPFPPVDGKRCFDTIQAAIDICVANRGDWIHAKRGSETVTQTVNFNKAGITVMVQDWGCNPLVKGEFSALVAGTGFTDGPVAKLTQPCRIEGMGFASRDAGTTFFSGAACLIGGNGDAAPFGVVMRHCRFPKFNFTNRIGLAIEGSSDCLVEECTFEGVGADFESGIYIQGATQNLVIRRNHFRDCDYAITLGAFAGGGPAFIIGPENIVQGADSKFLNSQANTASGVIVGNYFNTDQGTATFDRTTDQLDAQGIQLIGNFYKDESTGPT